MLAKLAHQRHAKSRVDRIQWLRQAPKEIGIAGLNFFDRFALVVGHDEGDEVAAGGSAAPIDGKGNYVQPTLFTNASNDMRVAQQEIFGPVLSISAFDSEDEAVALANDTAYGLAAYLQTGDPERARRVTARLRAGMVQINGAARVSGTPFGGYKHSGNGREGGVWGIEEFLEVKSITGCVWP